LDDAGHSHTISDLYEKGFNPVMSLPEYQRESSCDATLPIPADVAAEQAKLDAADVWAFVYPVWWTDCPAILKGWFDRVWTVGWAYHPQTLKRAKKALVLCAAGHTAAHLRELGEYQAMKTVMLTDRIYDRAETKEFQLFDGSAALPEDEWEQTRQHHLEHARRLGRELGAE
jgi:NAD(P)H dehydrogenase (quinone)